MLQELHQERSTNKAIIDRACMHDRQQKWRSTKQTEVRKLQHTTRKGDRKREIVNIEQEGESQCKRKREREITRTMSKRDLKDLQPRPYSANKDEEEEAKDDGDDDNIFTLRTRRRSSRGATATNEFNSDDAVASSDKEASMSSCKYSI